MPRKPPPTPHRPIRSRRPKATDRRAQILREAMRCFASSGFRGTTTREIAAAVGITEAALYRHFPSKQSLYDAIIDAKISDPLVRHLASAALTEGDDHAMFSSFAHTLLDRGLDDPDFIRLFFFTALEGHELSDPFFKSRIGDLHAFVTGYIKKRMDEGGFKQRDPGLCARAFLGMISDYLNIRVILAQDEIYPQSLDDVVKTFVGIFLAGMQVEDSSEQENPQ